MNRIRIVSSSGQNLRVNPEDGTVVEDGRIQPSDVRLGSPKRPTAASAARFPPPCMHWAMRETEARSTS
ncbi:DUF4394 domain-containing protein [Hymenobacter jejuensis]|uniref:DUF4394 domain-containing protein n=1 Tax=Hymenobacter jejuensis TaxID=2502781 RepID=A0A5B8A2Y9_9BACT|nr:DUF4394 domain-containing protein [Hymenobacter jejuensis]QDA61774.1 DUF4394 domain-containing protein [Hymenobacter jejuensis]